jgi:hypothetical protein
MPRASQVQLRPIPHLDVHIHTLSRYYSDADADAESLRKDSTDLYSNSLSSKGVESTHWLEASESSIHRAPMISLAWVNLPVTDLLASLITTEVRNENCCETFSDLVS